MSFEEFAASGGARLRASFVAAYAPELGSDIAADALAYGWENWTKLSEMENPTGYLYRVGQTSARRRMRQSGYLPAQDAANQPAFEPGLAPALERLTEAQRIAIVLVHALGWPLADVADVLDVSVSTVRTQVHRAMIKLRTSHVKTVRKVLGRSAGRHRPRSQASLVRGSPSNDRTRLWS